MREFLKRVFSYRKTLWTLLVTSLAPTIGVRMWDELVSYGIVTTWDGIGGPIVVDTTFAWMAVHPISSLAVAVLAWVAIAALLSERHIKHTSRLSAHESDGLYSEQRAGDSGVDTTMADTEIAQREVKENPTLRAELDRQIQEVERMRALLDASQNALTECKQTAAIDRLERFAERVRSHGSTIMVTVRFAVYDDYELAELIKGLVRDHTGWPVTIDGSNNPTIVPDKRFKVMFESGISDAFREVAYAFGYGQLVPGAIGHRAADRATDGHLVIEVLPTLKEPPV